ncbi:hypothetical protein CANINC_001937 [Pichia inconspicua]|uniref:Mitochondrial distribution and morphology protein 12 n=1 Tax=Pichia inconspicua TaxID=52247 RepID=A0A4T0X3P6_9ASCO|nr:hypothetical protein CANINC_001937 [[Candida] inconspicua]
MSFNVQWENICNDDVLAEHLRDFLNSKLAVVNLPHYLSNLQVVGFKFGDAAPEITIRDINVPFEEFYDALKEEEGEGEEEEEEVGGESESNVAQPSGTVRNIHSIPLTPRREGSPFGLPLPSPTTSVQGTGSTSTLPFTKNPFLIPRNNSGMVQMRQFGVGLANFGVGTPGAIGNAANGKNHDSVGVGVSSVALDYNNSSMSQMESESDYFQHNESYSKYNDVIHNVSDTSTDLITGDIERDRGMDVQFSVDVDWDSHIYIEITCDLLVNYPALEFIRLPVRLKITDVKIHSLLIVAYIEKRVFLSFLCDIDDDDDNDDEDNGESDRDKDNLTTGMSKLNLESRQNSKNNGRHVREQKKGKDRIDIIQDMNIEGEIGSGAEFNSEVWSDQMAMDADGNGLVLRNIGKIENFLLGTLRSLLIDELGWPDWIELDFNESEEEETESGHDKEETEDEFDGSENFAKDKTVDMEQALISDGEVDNDVIVRPNRRVSRRESRIRRERATRPDSYGDTESVYSHESYFTNGTDTTGSHSDDEY